MTHLMGQSTTLIVEIKDVRFMVLAISPFRGRVKQRNRRA